MPKRDYDVSRLNQAIQAGRRALEFYRTERRTAVKSYVGRHYSEEGTAERMPVNLLALYVSIVGRYLIAKNPRVMLSTFNREQKPAVAAMQAWCNRRIEQMNLAGTLQRVVLDALFSVGICKVALATPADAASSGWGLDAGTPYVERVDLDDFVFDVNARDFSEAAFLGHRYRIPKKVADDMYGKRSKDLAASNDDPYNLEGDERISRLGRGYQGNDEEFEDMVDLWEVYLPRHRVVLTLADDHLGGDEKPLKEQNWLGPERGPYHFLAYGMVPGNPMPKAPLMDLTDINDVTNLLYRKLIRQAERQKEILGIQGGAAEDGSRIQQANDGEIIRMDRPESAKPMAFGGANERNFVMADHLKQLFSYLAGGLDAVGGLSPQSKTLGQDRMLTESASRGIADMQDTTITFVAHVLKGCCWYWWKDPFQVMRAQHALPGMPELQLTRQVFPKDALREDGRPELLRRQGRFEDLDVQVDPYSMQHSTPASRLQAMNQVVTQIVLPMMQLLQAQGVAFDVNAYLSKVGRYLDMPDLAEILTIQEPPEGSTGQGGGPVPGKPASTERRYVRENVPTRTERGDSLNLRNALMGVDPGGAPKNGQPQMA